MAEDLKKNSRRTARALQFCVSKLRLSFFAGLFFPRKITYETRGGGCAAMFVT